MNVSKKGGVAAPFAALGLLAVCTVAWGLWNREMVPSLVAPSPTPAPLPNTPYYVQVRIGKHFDEDKNLVLEVPFRADGRQVKVYEKKKGVRWLIDVEAHRVAANGVRVGVQARKNDTSHGTMPHQAMLRSSAGPTPLTIDAPPYPMTDNKTGKDTPTELRWDVVVRSAPSEAAILDSHFLH